MKSKTFLTLAICAVAASLFAGCSTQKTRSGRNNSVLGGLFVYNSGSYQPVGPNTIDIDGTKYLGRVNPSGTQVSAVWGLVTFTDY
ncbi:hypothetical protein [Rariglobus hedericola]|uniref:Uncharacterized protein n=1 Tax=Rariglobus hedericola TaxID=2597822 RepID=A0A556QSR2_9BACT|nr:hypothetical protein [Rariglobus hedericola]TSJ79678.1 hypothetical protein FPL22_10435 [Rariglobus hedericola]